MSITYSSEFVGLHKLDPRNGQYETLWCIENGPKRKGVHTSCLAFDRWLDRIAVTHGDVVLILGGEGHEGFDRYDVRNVLTNAHFRYVHGIRSWQDWLFAIDSTAEIMVVWGADLRAETRIHLAPVVEKALRCRGVPPTQHQAKYIRSHDTYHTNHVVPVSRHRVILSFGELGLVVRYDFKQEEIEMVWWTNGQVHNPCPMGDGVLVAVGRRDYRQNPVWVYMPDKGESRIICEAERWPRGTEAYETPQGWYLLLTDTGAGKIIELELDHELQTTSRQEWKVPVVHGGGSYLYEARVLDPINDGAVKLRAMGYL